MALTYHLFISHSWKYGDAYNKLNKLLTGRSYFNYINHSVPSTNPIVGANTDRELSIKISNKVRGCHSVLMMAGVYSTYSQWINKEIEIAQSWNKPIIGIAPWGQERLSSVVQNSSVYIARWNTDSIVQAIRTYSIRPSS